MALRPPPASSVQIEEVTDIPEEKQLPVTPTQQSSAPSVATAQPTDPALEAAQKRMDELSAAVQAHDKACVELADKLTSLKNEESKLKDDLLMAKDKRTRAYVELSEFRATLLSNSVSILQQRLSEVQLKK